MGKARHYRRRSVEVPEVSPQVANACVLVRTQHLPRARHSRLICEYVGEE